jgi:pimeloyl-ACP methyl ester carboxylesterase
MEESPIHHTLVLIAYQWMFAWSFVVSRLLGVVVGQATFLFSLLVMSWLPFLSPCPHDKAPRPLSEINVSMCYPYLQIWKDIFTNKLLKAKYPKTPLLFIFGTKKNCMFHSPSFLKRIESMPHSRWLSYDVGHWVQLYEVDKVAKDLQAFLKVDAGAPVTATTAER